MPSVLHLIHQALHREYQHLTHSFLILLSEAEREKNNIPGLQTCGLRVHILGTQRSVALLFSSYCSIGMPAIESLFLRGARSFLRLHIWFFSSPSVWIVYTCTKGRGVDLLGAPVSRCPELISQVVLRRIDKCVDNLQKVMELNDPLYNYCFFEHVRRCCAAGGLCLLRN